MKECQSKTSYQISHQDLINVVKLFKQNKITQVECTDKLAKICVTDLKRISKELPNLDVKDFMTFYTYCIDYYTKEIY